MIRSPYLWLLPAGLLVIAALELPYGYYGFMRLCVCASSAIVAYLWFDRTKNLTLVTVVFALIAVLYNPIIRVHLDRSVWAPINLATAAAYVVGYLNLRRTERSSPPAI